MKARRFCAADRAAKEDCAHNTHSMHTTDTFCSCVRLVALSKKAAAAIASKDARLPAIAEFT